MANVIASINARMMESQPRQERDRRGGPNGDNHNGGFYTGFALFLIGILMIGVSLRVAQGKPTGGATEMPAYDANGLPALGLLLGE